MPIVECPAETPSYAVLRETLAPIFRMRPEFRSDAHRWDEPLFVARLRRLLAQLTPGEVPPGFTTRFYHDPDADGVGVTLSWHHDPETEFTGRGKTESLAFLDAAAKAYAHPYFRKMLDGVE